MDMVMLFWVMFQKQVIAWSEINLSSEFLRPDWSLVIDICRTTTLLRASPKRLGDGVVPMSILG